jgi:hypothetical protein
MARASLYRKPMRDPRCSYVVLAEEGSPDEASLRDLAAYLSDLSVAGCEVVVLDLVSHPVTEDRARVLRWVGRYLPMQPDADAVRSAVRFASCEKIVIAAPDVRYSPEVISQLCDLLEEHEVVEPQHYLAPLPWWEGIEAGRMLLHRAVDMQPERKVTFGFRKTAVRTMGIANAQTHFARDVFARRAPSPFREWLRQRAQLASDEFELPVKTGFFLALAPLLLLLALLGGIEFASGYAGLIAFASFALAVRGRIGAGEYFPLRSCFLAPLWIVERSLSVYWAVFLKFRGPAIAVAKEEVPARGYTPPNVGHG